MMVRADKTTVDTNTGAEDVGLQYRTNGLLSQLALEVRLAVSTRSKRRAGDLLFKALTATLALVAVLPFFLLLAEVVAVGSAELVGSGIAFLLTNPGPGLHGGIANAIMGTLLLVAVAGGVGIPISIFAAVYITEYTRPGLLRSAVEFAADVLAGIPSIVFGAFGFTFLVGFLGLGMGLVAGGLTLAFMIVPTVLRTTQEALKQVPVSLREASLALGATRWRTTWSVTIRAALPGIVTGVLLAIGRVMGETAPLIFTAGNNLQAPTSVLGPGSWVASMPYTIWAYISDPREYLQVKAHATAVVLIAMVLAVDIAANVLSRRLTRRLV